MLQSVEVERLWWLKCGVAKWYDHINILYFLIYFDQVECLGKNNNNNNNNSTSYEMILININHGYSSINSLFNHFVQVYLILFHSHITPSPHRYNVQIAPQPQMSHTVEKAPTSITIIYPIWCILQLANLTFVVWTLFLLVCIVFYLHRCVWTGRICFIHTDQ
jgi:hypothetical protein